ncbi:MAG TPA: alpha/beta fold hydrolase [Galbitalea sp.]|nr:alpha/beta fold hydrolase [Galbitalea sp.]
MTIVFLHPVGLDGDCWQFIDGAGLGPIVRYTMLSHGDRPLPAEGLSMESFADDVVENTSGMLDVVGLSLGGSVAQHVALRHPHRVRSVLVAASAAGGPLRGTHLARANETQKHGMSGMLDSTLQRWFTPAALARPDDPGVAYARARLLADDPEAVAATWRALSEHNTIDRLGAITLPVTVLHAAEDAAGGLEAKAEMMRHLPLGRLVVIPGPHMVPLENPTGFHTALVEHLDWVTHEKEKTV